jgi:hypothetical protein
MQLRMVWIASLPGETPVKTMSKMREIVARELGDATQNPE